MRLLRSLENLFRYQAVLLTTRSRTDTKMAVPVTSDDPLPVTVIGGGSSGAPDAGSSREATQQQLLSHMQAANGNSFILAQQASQEGVRTRLIADERAVGAPLSLSLSPSEARALDNPHGAALRRAVVHVVAGSVRRSIGGEVSGSSPVLSRGDWEELDAPEYAAYRVMAESEPVTLHIEFRTTAALGGS